jgi:miniconductance mechanosensitive channel
MVNIKTLANWFITQGLPESTANSLAFIGIIVALLTIALLVHLLGKLIIRFIVYPLIQQSKTKWDDMLIEHKVLARFSHFLPALVIHLCAPQFFESASELAAFFKILVNTYIIVVILLTLDGALNYFRDAWEKAPVGKRYPAKSFTQAAKLVINLIGLIFILAALLDKSPLVFFSGLGAITAILLLIFKDAILGLVAGFQLSINNMVMVGDWIEMDARGANGDVIDVSLTTVKVQNWDKTITTIPTYALITDSFKNWRGMSDAGARRIKRAIYIDLNSIEFLNPDLLKRLQKIRLLGDYLEDKLSDIEVNNETTKLQPDDSVNTRRLTNIGTFRAYCLAYIREHPKVHKDMTLMVRQLAPTETGLPLEIYLFTNDIEWVTYEEIQSDFFDHLLSALPEFELRAYQHPTGQDFSRLGSRLPNQ